MKYLLLLIYLLATPFCMSAQLNNAELKTLCRVWGMYKYFHPTIKSGKIDWDKPLLHIISKKQELNIEQAFNILGNGIANTKVITTTLKNDTCNRVNDRRFLWIDTSSSIPVKIKKELRAISNNTGSGYYNRYKSNSLDFGNEKLYSEIKTPSSSHYFLTLFRLYNIIEYFASYRQFVITQQNWEKALEQAIEKLNKEQPVELYNFSLTVKLMLDNLKDGHAYAYNRKVLGSWEKRLFPYKFIILDNKVFVKKAFLRKSSLNIGDEVLSINNEPVQKIVSRLGILEIQSNESAKNNRIARGLMRSAKYKDNMFEVKDIQTQQTKKVEVKAFKEMGIILRYKRDSIEKRERGRLINSKVAYINLDMLKAKKLQPYLEEFKNIPNLILDLRGYPSGTIGQVIHTYLTPDSFAIKYRWYTIDTVCVGKFYLDNQDLKPKCADEQAKNMLNKCYKGKIAVLVGNDTGSRSEILAMRLQQLPNALIIGDTTVGSLGGMKFFMLPYDIRTSYTENMNIYPDLTINNPIGVKIDILVKPTIKGLQQGCDEVLEKAVEYLNNPKK